MIHITLIFVDLAMALLMSAIWVIVIAVLGAVLVLALIAGAFIFAKRLRHPPAE